MKLLQGIDLLKVERIKRIYLNYNDKFLDKILTKQEIDQIKEKKKIYHKIASKFSAKEAASKALGTGFTSGITPKDIEILNLESGKPIVNLYGEAKKKIKNIKSSSVSISDEDDFIVAVVTFLVES